ncbi:protein SHORT-ROOT 1 [Lolium perenne]|uniref:protein SHORT-ROOT 1 n=1 Tax=Lolium perenne TaxID=4522 RepID=UPI0021EAFF42|nr:protein SHORT-ROOT 2-like [Lolium perenne]
MDTLFRLVSLHQEQAQAQASSSPDQHQQQSPYNSSRSTTSTGSRSSSSHHTHNHNNSHSYYYPHSHSHSHSHPYYNNNNSNNNSSGNSDSYYHDHHTAGGCYSETAAPYQLQEECANDHSFYMDEDFSSSSSSRQFYQSHPQPAQLPPTQPPTAPTPPLSTSSTGGHGLFEAADFSFPHVDINIDFGSPASSGAAGGTGTASSSSGGGGVERWAAQLLLECARSVAARDSQRVQQLMWMLNELASPYGDVDQKLASYFLQGLFARLTASGPRTLRTLAAASDRNTSFDSTRRTALKFQELSPWTSFGHVAANGAILESFLEAASAAGSSSSSKPQRLHILDLSNTFCTQWPTLLEALATRSPDETPHLSITTVVPTSGQSGAAQRVMREIGQRLEKFARLMGVPFSFRVVHHAGDLAELDLDALNLREGGATTALAVNCMNALRGVAAGGARRRDAFVASLRRLEPRVVAVVEEEADLAASGEEADTEAGFMKVFGEGLRFFSAYMDSLEESFPKTSNEKLALERAVGRAIVDLVSCPASESSERRETGASWARRMRSSGFSPVSFSEDVADDVRSLLRRYREGWSLREASADDAAAAGVFLAWKDQAVVWASAWRP